MNFVFYDTETTGTDTAFDQILQFAAIYTDSDFKEIERFEIRCRLLPHIVPAPGAMLVTGVSVSQLIDQSLPSHYQMMRSIRKKLVSWSPAVFIGHNILKFDEQLLRQAFYQTLHPLYLTNTNSNSRSDTLPMLQAVSLFAPDELEFPVNEKGNKVFKLDKLAPLNGFAHMNAHDALGDVEATIYMCRIIKEKASDIWASFMRFNQKNEVIDYTKNEQIYCLSEFYYGKPYSWLVTSIGSNPSNPSDIFLFDLSYDPENIKQLPDEQIVKYLNSSPKPVRRIRANSSPILMPHDKAPLTTTGIEIGFSELKRRAENLRIDQEFCKKLINLVIASKEPQEESEHVEQKIYDGFPSRDDEQAMALFHEVPWQERLAVLRQLNDERMKALGLRLIYCEHPELFKESEIGEYRKRLAARLLSRQENVPWRTLHAAIKEADEALSKADANKTIILQEHKGFLLDWSSRLSS